MVSTNTMNGSTVKAPGTRNVARPRTGGKAGVEPGNRIADVADDAVNDVVSTDPDTSLHRARQAGGE